MSALHITRGLPAAGKTTFARQWIAEAPETRARVNRDDLRAMLFAAPDYGRAQELAVTEASRSLVRQLMAAGWDVIADDTNLRPRYVREWERFALANGTHLNVHDFPCDVNEAVRRDAARDRVVGEKVIRDMAAKYTHHGQLLPVPPTEPDRLDEAAPYVPQDGTPWAVMVDIDGTLALHNGRSPYDLTMCHADLPNAPVIEAVQAAAADEMQVIYCSGREDIAREDTHQWLAEHVGVPGLLYMRVGGDMRRDAVVKLELFNRHIRHQWNVRYVLDDRQQVVDMWRSLGLTVFQVARGDF